VSSERADADAADAEEARSSIHADDGIHRVDLCRRVIEASVSQQDDSVSVAEAKISNSSNCIPNDDDDDDDDDAVRRESEG